MYSDNVMPLDSAILFASALSHAGITMYSLSDFMRITLRIINVWV